jgi:hypothetical protein
MPKPYKKRGVSRRKSNKRGGCSCLFSGGSGVAGPSPGLTQLSPFSYYPTNAYNNDPNYQVIDGRQTQNFLVKGGRKSRRKTAFRRKRNLLRLMESANSLKSYGFASGFPRNTGGKRRVQTRRRIRGGSGSGTLIGNTIDTLKTATEATVVGYSNFNTDRPELPYTRYINESPPRA